MSLALSFCRRDIAEQVVAAVTLLILIRQVLRLKLGGDTDCTDFFRGYPQSLHKNPRIRPGGFLTNYSKFTIHVSSKYSAL
jgi:hypothetical protein